MTDPRTKKLVIILAICGPLLIWRLVLLTKYLPASVEAMPQETEPLEDTQDLEPSPVHAEVSALLADPGLLEAATRVKDGPWGRDPFELSAQAAREAPLGRTDSVGAPVPIAPKISFTGVSQSAGRWMAMVQGDFVQVGDRIQETYRVSRIDKGSITLDSGGWQFRYFLGVEESQVQRTKGAP